jgi:predicted Zn-dependent protease
MNKADVALERKDMDEALDLYKRAEKLMPDNLELQFWKGVGLLNMGNTEKGFNVLEAVFEKNRDWQTLILRLPASGLLQVDNRTMKQLKQM